MIMKEMISPYRQTPSARPTKIRDLPRMEESSLIAPSAADAAAETATPPPIQESPVERAAAMYPIPVEMPPAAAVDSAANANGEEHGSEEHYGVGCEGCFIASFCLFTCGESSEGDSNAENKCNG